MYSENNDALVTNLVQDKLIDITCKLTLTFLLSRDKICTWKTQLLGPIKHLKFDTHYVKGRQQTLTDLCCVATTLHTL